jgi:dethiobiotin synthetase
VSALGACADQEVLDSGIRLPKPVSPHLAAELCGTRISVSSLVRLAREAGESRSWLIEGAGGVLVPLNQNELMIDLMVALRLPVLIVASSQLGTINHTLLTLEALRSRSIAIAGVLLNGVRNMENRRAIETFGDVRVVGEMPLFTAPQTGILAAWARNRLDTDGYLEQFFSGPPQC